MSRFIMASVSKGGGKGKVLITPGQVVQKGILATRKAYQAIKNSKTLSEYFDQLRKFNKSALESGLYKTSTHVSPERSYNANEKRLGLMEKSLKAVDEHDTWTGTHKVMQNLEKGDKNFIQNQKLAEYYLTDNFSDVTPPFVHELIQGSKKYKQTKAQITRTERGVPFEESKDATKLVKFLNKRFEKPSEGEDLISDIIYDQNVFTAKNPHLLRTKMHEYVDKIKHLLPENVLKNYQNYMTIRALGGMATLRQEEGLKSIHKLLEGKIQKIPTSTKVPIGKKREIAVNNLEAFTAAHNKIPKLIENISIARGHRGIRLKQNADFRAYKELFGEKNLLSGDEIVSKFGGKIRREEDRLIGKQIEFKDPRHRKLFNIMKGEILPYKGQKYAASRGHELEKEWWRNLPAAKREIFRWPTFPTHIAINAFHKSLNKFYVLSEAKRLKAIKAGDNNEVKRITENLRKIEKYIKDLRLESRFLSGKTISPYGSRITFQHKMRMLVENQKELLEKLDIIKADVLEMFKRPEGLKEGGLINDPLTATMHSGGLMDYGEMKPVAPLLEPGERQHLAPGGKVGGKGKGMPTPGMAVQYVKRQILPKVIGHVEKIFPQLEGPTSVKPIWKVGKETFDNMSNAVKQAMSLSKKYPDSTHKLIMARGADTAEASYEGGKFIPGTIIEKGSTNIKGEFQPEIVAAQETAIAKEVDTPAIMWKSPEAIKNAPIEIGQGKQWLGFLKKSVSPKELEDTSIGPYLEFHVPNKKISKAQLLKAFDEVSPKFDVIPLGNRDTKRMVNQITEKFNNVRGRMEGFSTQDKKALNVFEGAFTKLGQTEKMAGPLREKDKSYNLIGNEINRVMKQLYDIDNAIMNVGAIRDPRIPGPIRSIFGDLQELLKIRGAKHSFESSPKHVGQQVLPGGINYREYLFKSSPGSLRLNEPVYKPGHAFDLSDEMAAGTFVHTRISDRTDNFGRKLLFVEEIQSDMHQRIQESIRKGGSKAYATRQDKVAGIAPLVREMEKVQMKIDQVLAKDPKDVSIPRLYNERDALGNEIVAMKAKIGELSQSGTPEGPFQRSEDYGSFVAKYLLRLAKEGNYDGVAVSTGAIKNRLKSEAHGNLMDEEATGHYGFYDAIMQNALKKIAKKGNLDYTYTVINDGIVNWGNIPVLLLKEADKVLEGLPAFKEGGLVRENFVDVVPLL